MILPSKCQFLHSNVVSRKPWDLTWCFPPGVARFPSRSEWSWRHGGQDLTRPRHPLKNTKVGQSTLWKTQKWAFLVVVYYLMVSTDVLCWYFNGPPVPQARHGCWGWKHPSPRNEGSVGTKPPRPTPPLGPGSFNLISSGPQTRPDPWHGVWELLPEPERRTQWKVKEQHRWETHLLWSNQNNNLS